jgi:hypothetical protein
MRHVNILASLVVAAVAGSGCYTVEAQMPGTLRGDVGAADVEKVGTVKLEKGNTFLFWGLTGSPPPDFFSADLKAAVKAKGGDGAQNIVYESQTSCGDLFIGCITCGIADPREFTLSADVVRLKNAPVPGTGGGAVGAPNPVPPDAAAPAPAPAPAPSTSY